ncbi:MAG: caspase family protein [Dehalococcoides mccartyi]|uniref:caspase family protein n=1 Tax=Dehalococcoides mccartyi TaxID=61435 RepID=UPI0030F82460
MHCLKRVAISAILALGLLAGLLPQTPLSAASTHEYWAVVVGISDYQKITDVSGLANGAQKFAASLKQAWGDDHVKLLTNSNADKSSIKSALDWMIGQEDDNDTVVFFFAGHGDSQSYIAPYDAYYVSEWISSQELSNWLAPLESHYQAVILESCYSAGFADDLNQTGRLVLYSSLAEEVSWADGDSGLFSGYINDGLSYVPNADINGDGLISLEELFFYAQPRTTDESRLALSLQHPFLSDGIGGELSLIGKLLLTTSIPISGNYNYIIVDGQTYSLSYTQLNFTPGTTHEITALNIDALPGVRYFFNSWADGVTSASRSFISGANLEAVYSRQYLLTIDAPTTAVSGSGWYDQYTFANLSAPDIEEGGIRYTFTGWSGDITGPFDSTRIVMDKPKTVKANYDIEYLLNLSSPYGTPEGSGWYAAGSTVKLSAPKAEGFLIRQVFESWSGDYTGTEANAIITLNKPQNISANFKADYTFLYIAIGLGAIIIGWIILAVSRRRKIYYNTI